MTWKYEDVKKYIEQEGYILIDDTYKTSKNKLHLICPNNEDFIVSFDKFKNSNQRCRCEKCRGRNPRAYTYDYVKSVFEKEGYILKSKEYENCHQLLEVICPNGHDWRVTISHFNGKDGRRCYYCSHSRQYTLEEIRLNLSKYGYTLISEEYKNVNEKLEVKCPYGHIYFVNYHNFDGGKRCPHCNNKYSKGEYRIMYICNKYKITFNHQYPFSDCKNVNPLPFDFYLPQYNTCVEFDGEGHFEPRNWNGVSDEKAKESYMSTVRNDNIKTQYCKDNNIKLIRIPYWDFDNIEKIICQKLNIELKKRRKGNR